jgi:hypothetical protein
MARRTSAALAALVLCLGLTGAALPSDAAAKPAAKASKSTAHAKPKSKPAGPPQTVRELAHWVVTSGDNAKLPFVVIDKNAAVVAVFSAKGKLLGSTPALIGSAVGDDSAPGVGDRELADIPLKDRTTPAGRFIGGYGRVARQRGILWVDYATAISLHPVVTANPKEKRLQRLQSRTPKDNRITHGCINVSAGFYNSVVAPTFRKSRGLFYILPDTRPLSDVFPDFYVQMRSTAAPAPSPAPPEPPRPSALS